MDNKDEHKFNFSEETQDNTEAVEQKKKAVQEDAKGLFFSIKTFLKELLDFRQDTDRQATIDAIKGDIPFKGATAWILICSIFVASVGLNANSTAVVIGAMLISPLMGPILGIGLSVAINDIDTLRKSLVNIGVMILLSVITAFLFFKFFPLQEESSELLARTKPDIRDVLIAFFGGSALIIARTKKGTIASVIFGVAIATALMPPLCTVGYGLAVAFDDVNKGLGYAFGALYLFTINTIFIALATFIALKVLRFPMIKYANSKRRKRISQFATLLAISAMIPAVWTFVDVLRESNFSRDARRFVQEELKGVEHAEYIRKNTTFNYESKDESYIVVNSYGLAEIEEPIVNMLKERMKSYSSLSTTKLIINQASGNFDSLNYLEQLRNRDSLFLISQQEKISGLENRVKELSLLEHNSIPFEEVSEEIAINYDKIEEFGFASMLNSNFSKIDTLSVFTVKFKDSLSTEASKNSDIKKLEKWLKFKFELDTVIVKRTN